MAFFFFAVVRCHDQGNLQMEEFIWGYGFRGLEFIAFMAVE